jgi:hypothetical protein
MYPISFTSRVRIIVSLQTDNGKCFGVIVHKENAVVLQLAISPRAREREQGDEREAEDAEEPAADATVFHGDLLSVLKVFMSFSRSLRAGLLCQNVLSNSMAKRTLDRSRAQFAFQLQGLYHILARLWQGF